MRIAMTGATGLIGYPVGLDLTRQGHQLILLTRSSRKAESMFPGAEVITWDAISEPPPSRFLEGVDGVIHLAGENLAGGRWDKRRREAIRDSRVIGTRNLVAGLVQCQSKPKVLVSASAVGFYGDRGPDEVLDEQSAAGNGFLAELCQRWEAEAEPAREAGIRLTFPRTGVVLAEKGGALQRMASVFRKFVGGPLGHGRYGLSWIHLDDAVRAILLLLNDEQFEGPVNITSPSPVSNREFSKALGRALGRPSFLPTPAFALKLLMGDLARHVLLQGQYVVPTRLERSGFRFSFPDLKSALENLLH